MRVEMAEENVRMLQLTGTAENTRLKRQLGHMEANRQAREEKQQAALVQQKEKAVGKQAELRAKAGEMAEAAVEYKAKAKAAESEAAAAKKDTGKAQRQVASFKEVVARRDEELAALKLALAEQEEELDELAREARVAVKEVKQITNYLDFGIGRPPLAMPKSFREKWDHKNSLSKKKDAHERAELEDQLQEREAEVAYLEANGTEPIFSKGTDGTYPVEAMVMVFEMYTHMSSAESIEKDLVSMHKHVYPNLKRGVDYCIPGVATLTEWRGDSQFFTEIIAAVRCGRAPYWKQLFHDGSSDRRCTKIFSTLASIPDEDIGGKHDALLLRGLHLIAGGESADEIADIRTTVDRMTRWAGQRCRWSRRLS
jgi:hypothetical protein